MNLQSQIQSLSSKVESLEARVARGVAPAPGAERVPSPGAEAAPAIAKAPVASAPKAAPMSPAGGMMGELKQLLAARRKKASSDSE